MTCPVTTTGPALIPCQRHPGHDGGHLWHGTDVPDRHADDTEDPR